MITYWQSVVAEQLMILGMVYTNIFCICHIYKKNEDFFKTYKIVTLLFNYAFMLVAYKIAQICAQGTGIFAVLILSGLIHYIFGVNCLVLTHTMALFTSAFLNNGLLLSKKYILLILLCVLIGILNFKSSEYNGRYSGLVVLVPTLVCGILFCDYNTAKMIYIWIIGLTMMYLGLCGGYNIIQSTKMMKTYYSQCITDPLTGLYNRRRIDTIEDMRKDYSVIMIDIDDFKDVNSKFGHMAGDMCLKSVANVVLSCCGSDDISLRVGGDEFMIICTGKEHQYIVNLAEKIREDVQSFNFIYDCKRIGITVSIGIKSNEDNLDSLVYGADCAMYCSKSNGKNKVTSVKGKISDKNEEASAEKFII